MRKKLASILGVVLGFILGFLVTYNYDEPKMTYQGKSAEQWAKMYQDDERALELSKDAEKVASARADACEKDPSSDDCDDINHGMAQLMGNLNCNSQASSAAEVYWRYKNCPSPTPVPNTNTQAIMPSWCRATINAYNAAYQHLGYSKGAINEILKKDNPECATY